VTTLATNNQTNKHKGMVIERSRNEQNNNTNNQTKNTTFVALLVEVTKSN